MVTSQVRVVPVLASRNSVVYPGMNTALRVGRLKSKNAVEKAQAQGGTVIVVAQRQDSESDPAVSQIYKVGTLCKIDSLRGNLEQGYHIVLRGVSRVQLTEIVNSENIIEAQYEVVENISDVDSATLAALRESIKTLGNEILDLIPADTRQLKGIFNAIDDEHLLTHLCADNLQLSIAEKQALLEMPSLKQRSLELLQHMQKQKETLKLQSDIRDRVSQKFGKQQREAILREQIRAIQAELGETAEGADADGADFAKKIEEAAMPEDVKKVALAEAKRLEAMNEASAEANVVRNYLELLCSMPWKDSPAEAIDLLKAKETLEADHFGLEKIKKRITQHLAVMKLKGNNKGSIVLFVGPPGVGKTSLGQSVAKALNRKYVRVSLGGVRDDSEIRGHRRTYVGAMPGRIIQGIKRAGSNNPVFVLDEIDKLGQGFHGDPAAALLEVLDPEQNMAFADHYLDVPYDLSKVFFIATANSLDGIPGPLLDRMEVIEVSGYTTAEKMHIAKNHLITKQLAEHGMNPSQLTISDETLMRTISHHTREAGVRELQRHIAAICRASTEKVVVAEATQLPIRVEAGDLDEILGPERFQYEVAEKIMPAGVVTGLAWTPRGGDILFIESSLMPGHGKLTLTGQLGEVMKESAHIALSLVRSSLANLVPMGDFDKRDVHIHVPAGAIPKDGPSAGVTLLTALASLFTGRSVSPKLAMTGEVTLRGAVTPVGGIKEKVMAAHRAGIERIILSKRNEKDLRDVPQNVRDQIRFDFVETASEVLALALGSDLQDASPMTGPGIDVEAASDSISVA